MWDSRQSLYCELIQQKNKWRGLDYSNPKAEETQGRISLKLRRTNTQSDSSTFDISDFWCPGIDSKDLCGTILPVSPERHIAFLLGMLHSLPAPFLSRSYTSLPHTTGISNILGHAIIWFITNWYSQVWVICMVLISMACFFAAQQWCHINSKQHLIFKTPHMVRIDLLN